MLELGLKINNLIFSFNTDNKFQYRLRGHLMHEFQLTQ